MKIFICNNGVSLHRLIVPFQALTQQLNISFITSSDDPQLIKNEVVMFNRTMPDGWLETLKSNNNTLICDIDDAWFLPKEHPLFNHYLEKQTSDKIIKHLRGSDYITTTTEYLKNKLREELDLESVIFPNAISIIFQNKQKNNNGKIKFGVVGSTSHLMDTKLLEGIADLPQPYLDKIQFVNCGFGLNEYSLKMEKILTNDYKNVSPAYAEWLKTYQNVDYIEDNEPYKRIWSKDIWTYMQFFTEIDYLLIPLINNEFNRCKSPLKLAECGASNTIPVCSDVLPYSPYLNSNISYLVSNTSNSWRSTIIKVIKNDALKREIFKSNVQEYNKTFNLEEVNKERLEWLKKICNL